MGLENPQATELVVFWNGNRAGEMLVSARYPSASLFVGGYEHEERQPHPLVARDFDTDAEAQEASRWLTGSGEKGLLLQMGSTPTGELEVSVSTASEILCQTEVWKDEMWRIFMEYYRQGEPPFPSVGTFS